MRWPVLLVAAYLALALQLGLLTLLQIGSGGAAGAGGFAGASGASPNWLLILLVLVAMWATPMEVAWTALLLGVIDDLTMRSFAFADRPVDYALIGPGAIGFLVAGFAVLQLRGLVFRDSVLAAGALVFIAGLLARITTAAILALRTWSFAFDMPIPGWHASDAIVQGFVEVLLSALLAMPVGLLFRQTIPAWGFAAAKSRHGGR